jgi:uncharacterized membrane protein (DUF4010 family)
VVATAIMFLRIGVVVTVFDWPLARQLMPSLLALALLGAAIAFHDWRRICPGDSALPRQMSAPNPLQLVTALSFAAMFVAVALLTNWVRGAFGEGGLFTLAAITGATDIDPFVLSLAQGSVAAISPAGLCAAILIAASSNNALKAAYAVGFGGLVGCRRPAGELLALAVAGVAAAGGYLYWGR